MATHQQHLAKSARAPLLREWRTRRGQIQQQARKHRVRVARHKQADTLDAGTTAAREEQLMPDWMALELNSPAVDGHHRPLVVVIFVELDEFSRPSL